MAQPETEDRNKEYIWYGRDFGDLNLASLMRVTFAPSTMGDLAQISEEQLAGAGFSDTEVEVIGRLLASRGLEMRQETDESNPTAEALLEQAGIERPGNLEAAA